MKRIIILLLFLITSIISITAQTDFTYPELLSKDSTILLSVHNGQLITIKQDKKKNFFLSVDNKTDTLKVNFPNTYWELIPIHNNTENNIYVQTTYDSSRPITNMYKLNLDTKTFTNIKELKGDTIVYFKFNNSMIVGGSIDKNVYEYNMQTMKTDTLFDGGFGYGMTSNFLLENKSIISYWESGVIEDFALFDFNNRQMTYPVKQFESFSYSDKANASIYFRDVAEQYYNVGLFWVDKDFNIIQPTLLPYYDSYASYNLGGSFQSFCYRFSHIERKPYINSVWVICKFSLPFDKALYDIYHNTLLEKAVVEKFDEWELHKLRNMIFAKHGYRFKSEYLQAFYNLFDFYNHITKTNNVNALLTPEDNKNLELIRQAEVYKKK